MSVSPCATDAEILATYPVMRQLRPHLASPEAYLRQVREIMAAHGFSLLGCFRDGVCVGVAGYTIETRLHRGKVLYVADLVTDSAARSTGVGRELLTALRETARTAGCTAVVLDSGTQRLEAHSFYFREGFRITAFNFHCAVSGAA